MSVPRKVLVVGGGIAGFTFAAALQRKGVNIEVVDLAPELRPIGSGIAIGFNGILALNSIGLGASVRERGAPLPGMTVLDADGRRLNGFKWTVVEDIYGTSTVGIHRGALHDVLAESFEGDVRLGITVSGLHEIANSVVAEFSDGTSAEYDFVVGADGLNSQVRNLTFGEVPRQYAGYSAIRVVVPRPPGIEGMYELWGRDRRMGILPIGKDLLYSYSTFLSAQGVVRNATESADFLRELFGTFSGPAKSIIESVNDGASIHSGDIEQVILPRWHTRRIALIGDAAHAMCPDLGQGGSMAIEDAVLLARALAGSGEIDNALLDFHTKRYKRVREIQRASRRYGWMVHGKTAPARVVRRSIKWLDSDRLARSAVSRLLNPVA